MKMVRMRKGVDIIFGLFQSKLLWESGASRVPHQHERFVMLTCKKRTIRSLKHYELAVAACCCLCVRGRSSSRRGESLYCPALNTQLIPPSSQML